MQGMHNKCPTLCRIGPQMRARKPKPFEIPEIVEGMCGTCQHWWKVEGDETAECAVLAKAHLRGSLVKIQLPERDTTWMGNLERMVYERTMDATGGFEMRWEGEGEIVEAERFSGVPRKYIDLDGQEKTVWSPLRTYAWGGCSRWEKAVKGSKAA